MPSKRNYHGLSESGVFYRDRDGWMQYVAGRTEWYASERLVLIYIAMRSMPGSRDPYPRQATIAADLNVSVATVRRAIDKAKEHGIIAVQMRKPPKGKKAVNHYRLIHPADR